MEQKGHFGKREYSRKRGDFTQNGGFLWKRRLFACLCAVLCMVPAMDARADLAISAPSAILIEASTGQIIYELNADQHRSPASITKIMTLLLAFEQLGAGKIKLDDIVVVSQYASSMGGSQVFLAEGETQDLETMLKCVVVASGNDASVAVAEHIAGSEEAFVQMMNEKAASLGMTDTHFEDCCGLTDSDGHYTTAKDVALMSRELITLYPEVYEYTKIWMEDITHVTPKGSSLFTLSSTNKLLKRYQWATGLKTGSTSKALYCLSATARKNDIDLIAVVMAAPSSEGRFKDAAAMLNYGFSVSDLYIDENTEALPELPVKGGVEETVSLRFQGEFRYLDTSGISLDQVEEVIELPETVLAPVRQGEEAGKAVYRLGGTQIGSVPILYCADIEKAVYKDYLMKMFKAFLL
ncbi:MAG: D-alanyl-D-alanine carboxypeptidase [Clostridium sp.]|nr:D-alanyl-D-alanine carboxypeptidase [Clostridium sp.]